jgi:ATP-dependent RNA helicase DeaD
MVRVFLAVGERDGVRPADLVGAIASEGGVGRTEIGRIAIRESHSIVEIAAGVAHSVIERIAGVSVRGRRLAARVDRGADREQGSGRARGGRSHPQERRGGRSDEARSGGDARSPRAIREQAEWSGAERGERVRHARRRRDDR